MTRPQTFTAADIRSSHTCPREGRIAKAWRAYWQRRARLATVHLLHALDDRTLHDMGLTRSTIPAAVAGELYRPGAPSNENAGEAKVQVLKTRTGAAA
jgi:uncharacterized protein YjiS (DUF1127 family)